MLPVVYVARTVPQVAIELLQPVCEIRMHEGAMPPSRDELLVGVKGAAGILSLLSDRIDAEVFDAAGPSLKAVSNFAVGFNNIDTAEAARRGIAVGNTPDVLTDATADLAVGLMLSVARNFSTAQRDAREGNWKTWEPMGWIGQDLAGKTLGIVGMGRIGFAVAERLSRGWGMSVLYTSRQRKANVEERLSAEHVELERLLAESDFVSLHVALCSATQNLIGRDELQRMKRNAVLVNTARGEVVDQEALVEALQTGQIFGAGLDVCTPEPLPTDHPLLSLSNCLLLPHIGSATKNARNAMAERAARNILAGIAGDPLPYPVS